MTKKEKNKKPRVNKELDGFDIKIDSFGEISSNIPIEEINTFLNKNVDDKKLRDREDLEDLKRNTNESSEEK